MPGHSDVAGVSLEWMGFSLDAEEVERVEQDVVLAVGRRGRRGDLLLRDHRRGMRQRPVPGAYTRPLFSST